MSADLDARKAALRPRMRNLRRVLARDFPQAAWMAGEHVEALLAVVAVGMGIFLSIFARNELQAVQFIPIVILPQAFLSGFLWPIQDMPGWLQPFSYVMPMTYGIRALRDVMVKGFGFTQILPDVGILTVLAAATLVLAALSLRREIA